METDFQIWEIWPDEVLRTYWRYDAVATAHNDDNVILFLGINFEWEFVVAAIFGAVVIWLFARRTFNKPSFEPASINYRVLKELSPSDLRSHSQVRRAYAMYAGLLILIYGTLTFFGKLILDLFNPVLNTAGLSFNASSLDFRSPEWPMLISLGMIGLIPMLRPVEIVERGIRRLAHQRAGIPVHIHQRCADVRKALDDLVEDTLEARLQDVPEWAHQSLNDPRSVRRAVEALEQLGLLRNWLMDERAHWPAVEQRQRIGRLEQVEVKESGVVLDELYSLMAQDFNTPQPMPATAHLTEDQRLLAHRNHLIAKWKALSSSVERHRDELIAILVVYAERDENYGQIEDQRLEALTKSIFARDPAPSGPETGIAWSLVPIFFIYFAAALFDLHPKLGALPPDSLSVTATFWTAFLETARVAILFWLPVLAVMGVRVNKWEATERSWARLAPGNWTGPMQRQLLTGINWALLLSLIGLGLVAILWAAMVSRDTSRFAFLLYEAPLPYLWGNLTLAGIAGVHIVAVMLVTDAEESSPVWRWRWGVGLFSAVLVLVWKIAHWAVWLLAAERWDLFYSILWRDKVSLAIYAIIALSSVTMLMPRRQGEKAPMPSRQLRENSGLRSRAGALFGVGIVLIIVRSVFRRRSNAANVVALCFVALFSARVEAETAEQIDVGFRADAAPFSYLIERGTGEESGEERYSGYIADLCYKIFASNAYRLKAINVTANDRFEKLKNGEIDVLCDPVTLRYSRGDGRAEYGVFSPIVFVTGVSYLWRQEPDTRPPEMLIAYVDKTSAEEVAKHACETDHFRWRDTQREFDPAVDCEPRKGSECGIPTSDDNAESGKPDNRTYKLCKASSHDELVAWICAHDQPEGDDQTEAGGQAEPELKWSKAYFGDQDIINGKLDAWIRAGNECAEVERQREVYTYEPYALVISRRAGNMDLIAHVQRRIYEIFSNRPEALALFVAHFPGKTMSVPLANLFLLNAVERPECLQPGPAPGCVQPDGDAGADTDDAGAGADALTQSPIDAD
jgi:Bacterial extracellular solute-binding proteins, family 3